MTRAKNICTVIRSLSNYFGYYTRKYHYGSITWLFTIIKILQISGHFEHVELIQLTVNSMSILFLRHVVCIFRGLCDMINVLAFFFAQAKANCSQCSATCILHVNYAHLTFITKRSVRFKSNNSILKFILFFLLLWSANSKGFYQLVILPVSVLNHFTNAILNKIWLGFDAVKSGFSKSWVLISFSWQYWVMKTLLLLQPASIRYKCNESINN